METCFFLLAGSCCLLLVAIRLCLEKLAKPLLFIGDNQDCLADIDIVKGFDIINLRCRDIVNHMPCINSDLSIPICGHFLF